VKVSLAERLKKLPPYLFAELDAAKQQAISSGVEVIDLGVGDPDLPTPQPIIQALQAAAEEPANHRYPSYEGLLAFRQAAADWLGRRFGVQLDPGREVLSLIGSKEGIAHLPLAFLNPGDVALLPDPAYPVYQSAVVLAGGEPYFLPLLPQNNFLPDFSAVPEEVWCRTRLLFLNYPNNPTAAVADGEFFRQVVELAQRYGFIVCHDAAYTELFYDDFRPMSILQVDGAKEVAIEFHSLSKTYNMTGWRIGFAAGCAEVLAGLGKVKTNIDSGIFQAIQYAGIVALHLPDEELARLRKLYAARRQVLVEGLQRLGYKVEWPKATFYVWLAVPQGEDSTGFCRRLLTEAGVVATPGVGFGKAGEGFVRFALTVGVEQLKEAVGRMSRL